MKQIIVYISIAYIFGLLSYSEFFLFTSNQNAFVQVGKMFIASLHYLFLALPIWLSIHSRNTTIVILSFILSVMLFFYLYFLVTFFNYFYFIPSIFDYSVDSIDDTLAVADHYFKQVVGFREISIVILLVLYVALFLKRSSMKITNMNRLVIFVTALVMPVLLVFVSIYNFGHPSSSSNLGGVTMVRRFGPITHFVYELKEELSYGLSDYISEPQPFPGPLIQLIDASFTPIVPEPPVLNIIDTYLIQIESFDNIASQKVLNGVKVMPFLSSLSKQCIYFENFHTIKGVGGSSDAEFAVATGLHPSRKKQSVRNIDVNKIKLLYQSLDEKGVKSYFAHNNQIGFYGRNKFYSGNKFLTTFFLDSESESEVDFALRTSRSPLEDNTKSFYYFFNFQSHGPYQGYSSETRDYFGKSNGELTKLQFDYMLSMHEIDQMLERIFELQKDAFNKSKNLFMITADHPSGLFLPENVTDRTKIPLYICHSSFNQRTAINPASHIDLYSTILGVYAAEGSGIGADLLSTPESALLLPDGTYVFQSSNSSVRDENCDGQCAPFYSYTDQFIRP